MNSVWRNGTKNFGEKNQLNYPKYLSDNENKFKIRKWTGYTDNEGRR